MNAPTDKKLYKVTDVAGPRPEIAGKRRKAGEEIRLTWVEAQYEVLRGTVEEIKSEGDKRKSKKAAADKPTTEQAEG